MRLNKRMVLMGLVVMALMILSMSLSMARSWPVNPIFLAPGAREPGSVVPGTYGHLVPLLPFPGLKEPSGVLIPTRTGNDEGTTPGHYANSSTGGSSHLNPGSEPISSNKSGGGLVAGNSGMPMGNYFSGSGAVNHVEYLQNDIRDAIRKLNSK